MSTRDHKRRRRTATRIRRTGQTRTKQESHEAVVDEPIDADAREHYRREKARRAERSRPPDHPLEQARRAYHAMLAADAVRERASSWERRSRRERPRRRIARIDGGLIGAA